jgi:hypothetical protein
MCIKNKDHDGLIVVKINQNMKLGEGDVLQLCHFVVILNF